MLLRRALPAAHFDRNAAIPVTDLVHSEFSGCCAKVETGIKHAGYAAAYDFVFGAWLVDRLGGL
jgi:hypothetical protein